MICEQPNDRFDEDMEIGESATRTILASEKWNGTQIKLVAGAQYHCTARGQWTDSTIVCNADGYTSSNPVLRASEWLRRAPNERWFALIGTIERNEANYFLIGVEATIAPKAAGLLYCFANDVSFMYWNNKGEIQLTVIRTG